MNFGKLEEGSYHQESLASVRDETLGVMEKKKSRMIEERTRTETLEKLALQYILFSLSNV